MNEKMKTNIHIPEQPGKPEFRIGYGIGRLPAYRTALPISGKGLAGYVYPGCASIQVFDNEFKIVPAMVLTLLPWQLVSIKEISPNFRMAFFCNSQTMFMDTLSGLWRLRPGFFFLYAPACRI